MTTNNNGKILKSSFLKLPINEIKNKGVVKIKNILCKSQLWYKVRKISDKIIKNTDVGKNVLTLTFLNQFYPNLPEQHPN